MGKKGRMEVCVCVFFGYVWAGSVQVGGRGGRGGVRGFCSCSKWEPVWVWVPPGLFFYIDLFVCSFSHWLRCFTRALMQVTVSLFEDGNNTLAFKPRYFV